MIGNYKRDGFAVLENAVPERWLPQMTRQEMHESFAQSHADSVEEYLQQARLFGRAVTTMHLFVQPAVFIGCQDLGVRTPIFQTNPAIHIMAEDLKIPGGYDGIAAHQDWPALQSGLNTVVVWIPFYDVSVDNFPVELVPGSHRQGLRPAKPEEHISAIDDTGLEYVPVPVKRGQALVFSVFAVHRTRTQGRGFRMAASHRYEDASDPTFVSMGYPSAQRRVIERELKWTPSVQSVEEVFK